MPTFLFVSNNELTLLLIEVSSTFSSHCVHVADTDVDSGNHRVGDSGTIG